MIRYIKRRIRSVIKEAVSKAERLHLAPFGDAFWYEQPNLWEPTVQLALRDLCEPGAVVYDVGANFGGLTAVMSRLVGPRGIVVSFEASPRIVGHVQANIVKQGLNNVYLQHRAVYSRTGDTLEIYPGDHLNDSIYSENSPTGTRGGMKVKTVALDDFVAATGLVPSVVKMDIEGAEFDALKGAAGLLAEHRPHLLLEQQADDPRCLDLVAKAGYRCFDLNNYREVRSPADYPPGSGIRNLLALHESRLLATPYRVPFRVEDVVTIDRHAFTESEGSLSLLAPLSLGRGRYLADVDFAAQGADNEMWCGVELDGRMAFRYHAYTRLLASSYRDWVFDVDSDRSVSLFFRFLNGTADSSFLLRKVTITRLLDFTPMARSAIVLN
jgi:FkbM family methyltransferase